MELKRARHYAELVRGMDKGMRTYAAIVTLDDRITELEGQRNELVQALIQIKCELLPYKTNPTADHTGPIDHIIAMCGRLTEIKQPGVAG